MVVDYEALCDLQESQGKPLVSIAKYHRTPPSFSPSIIVYAEASGFVAEERDLFNFDFADFARALDDFVLEQRPARDQIGRLLASRTVYSYQFTAITGEAMRMRTNLYATLKDGLMFSFNLTGLHSKFDTAFEELDLCRRSIRFFDV